MCYHGNRVTIDRDFWDQGSLYDGKKRKNMKHKTKYMIAIKRR